MGELLMRRREMILPDDTPVLPAEYKQTEYTERPNSVTSAASGWNSTGFTPNGTDTLVFRMGIMCTKKPPTSDGSAFLGNRQNSSSNTTGACIAVLQNLYQVGVYDGRMCLVQPNNGSSVLNTKIDLVATKKPADVTVTDGTHTNTVSGTPRAMYNAFSIFGITNTSNSSIWAVSFGRIYYLQIFEADVLKVNLVPCKRISDSVAGFYDTVSDIFRYSAYYTAGPEV